MLGAGVAEYRRRSRLACRLLHTAHARDICHRGPGLHCNAALAARSRISASSIRHAASLSHHSPGRQAMSIISFFKEAGEKLFGHKDTEAAAQQAQAAPDNAALQAQAQQANQTAATAILTYIKTQ